MKLWQTRKKGESARRRSSATLRTIFPLDDAVCRDFSLLQSEAILRQVLLNLEDKFHFYRAVKRQDRNADSRARVPAGFPEDLDHKL